MRTLHITPSVRMLGARKSLLTLVHNLMGTRIEPLVAVPGRGGLTEEFDRLHIPYIEWKMPPWRKASAWLDMSAQATALHDLVREHKIDLIHCNEIYPNPHALIASGIGNPKRELLVRLLHGRMLKPLSIPVVTHMRLSVTPPMVRKYYLAEATRLIAVSHGAASDFDAFAWKQELVRVVHNGIDTGPFEDALKRRSDTRARLGYQPDDFVIGQIGLMMPRKRPGFLLDAAPEILRKMPQAKFLFIGDSSPGQEGFLNQLKTRSKDLCLDQVVTFLPFQPKIADYFAALELNMLVSDDEGFGRVILEAAAAGVPTIASRVGGIPELIEDEVTGYLLGQSDDSDEVFWREIPRFAQITTALADNRQLYIDMSQAALQRAKTIFSVEKYVTGTIAVFEEALAEFERRRNSW